MSSLAGSDSHKNSSLPTNRDLVIRCVGTAECFLEAGFEVKNDHISYKFCLSDNLVKGLDKLLVGRLPRCGLSDHNHIVRLH